MFAAVLAQGYGRVDLSSVLRFASGARSTFNLSVWNNATVADGAVFDLCFEVPVRARARLLALLSLSLSLSRLSPPLY